MLYKTQKASGPKWSYEPDEGKLIKDNMLLKEMRIHWATYAFLLVWNMYWLSLLHRCLRVQMISSAFFLKWPI